MKVYSRMNKIIYFTIIVFLSLYYFNIIYQRNRLYDYVFVNRDTDKIYIFRSLSYPPELTNCILLKSQPSPKYDSSQTNN